MHKGESKEIRNNFSGSTFGKALHRIGAALGGLWITSSIINLTWPLPDQVAPNNSLIGLQLNNIPIPKMPISLLIIGVNNSSSNLQIEDNSLRSLINLNNISLIKISPNKPLHLIQIPTELEIILPGEKNLKPLSKIHQDGGVELSANIVSKLLKLPKGEPQRYLIANTQTLEKLINGVGGVTVSLNTSFSIKSINKKQSVFLPAAVQDLNGFQVGKVLAYKGKKYSKAKMRMIKKAIVIGFWRQLRSPESTSSIQTLSKEIIETTTTNLSQRELISFIYAIRESQDPPVLEVIPSF